MNTRFRTVPKRRTSGLDRARQQAEALARGEPHPRTVRRKPGHQEDDEQKALFQWARLAVCTRPELELLHSIPNGGNREAKEAKRLVEQGVLAGIPDVDLPVPRVCWYEGGPIQYHGLRIEMKRPIVKGESRPEVRKDQKRVLTLLQNAGYCCCVCYGQDQAKAAIIDYLDGLPPPHQWGG